MKSAQIDTPSGPARAYLHFPESPKGALVLGHGAGGGVEAPDLVAATEAAVGAGFRVALVEQPYRVAGRRSPAAARQLDAAWIAVLGRLRTKELAGLPLIVGGRFARSPRRLQDGRAGRSGRCPLSRVPPPPPRRGDKAPQSRLPELDAVKLPVLVVQGESDRFGMPPAGPDREVVRVRGDHGLKADTDAVAAAVRAWLASIPTGVGA